MGNIRTENLNVFYGKLHALKNVNMEIAQNKITALIGPSGCGKSTMLKCINRMNDLIDGCKVTGKVLISGVDVYNNINVNDLRTRVGMVFQKPNVFPMTVYDNIAFGPRTHGIKKRIELDQIVTDSLKSAGLWDEVKDRLKKSALELSGGQQQRVCIARALAVSPEILLMDEPTSALDPISMNIIERLLTELKQKYTIVIATHNLQQATRIADKTAFFLLGEMLEYGEAGKVLSNPEDEKCKQYISGRFG